MQVDRREVKKAPDSFARYPAQSFTILPDGLVAALVVRKVGRNGWAVMMALCHMVFSDGKLGVVSAKEIAARTGLTEYQVARGMTDLREHGIIAPVIRKNAAGYRHPDKSTYRHVAQYCICKDVWAKVELQGQDEDKPPASG